MSKKAAAQPEKVEVKIADLETPVVENNVSVTTEIPLAEAKKQVATTAAVEKPVPKPSAVKKAVATKLAKKIVAEKPAPALKTPSKAVATAAKEKAIEVLKAEKTAKVKKQVPKKPKLIRDSFTIPDTDYALFETLKQRALSAGVEVKKSEILRAAVVTLAKLDDAELVKAIGLVERIKTGRPKK